MGRYLAIGLVAALAATAPDVLRVREEAEEGDWGSVALGLLWVVGLVYAASVAARR